MASIYKILPRDEWRAARTAGLFEGSGIDRRDGYIHFSTAQQAQETARLHFKGAADLVVLEIDADALGTELVWEPSRGGQLFPHLYGKLPAARVITVHEAPLDGGGFPALAFLTDGAAAPTFSPDPARVFAFLKPWAIYQPTPVRDFKTADGTLFIKDETARMGLGAFKALGGPFAVARLLEDRWTEVMKTPIPAEGELRAFAKDITFVCASAGNHGMAVAAGARHAGARARIHLAANVAQDFADRLGVQGAAVVRSGDTYEESVAAATRDARETNSILLADASWPGYHRPPALVMEGYTVMAEELRASFEQRGEWPTDVFVQAGVGGLAGALAHMIRANWRVQPRIVVVEPEAAPCLRDSHRAGKPVTVTGPASNMGRLDCKDPSLIAFDILRRCDVVYRTVSDDAAAAAQRAFRDDYGITTTPSGAAGLAARLADESARALVIATEGAVG